MLLGLDTLTLVALCQ